MKQIKAQASMEFLILFGIALSIILIAGGVFFSYTGQAKGSFDQKQVTAISQELITNVEKMYFLGPSNRVTSKISFPDIMINFSIHQSQSPTGDNFSYLNFTYGMPGNTLSEIVYPQELYIRLNCTYSCNFVNENLSYYNYSDITAGIKNIRIESFRDYVAIDFIR